MYRNCITEKSAQQQQILEQQLLTAMLTTPFHEISISSLCEAASVSRKTFYRLFDRKEDVLDALIDQTIMDFETFRADDSVGPGALHRFFAYWKGQEKLIEALIRNDMPTLLWERVILHTLRESPDIKTVFIGDDQEFARETVIFYISGLFVLILDWHAEGYRRSIDDISRLVMRLLTTSPAKGPLAGDPYCKREAWLNGVYHPELAEKDLP